MVESRTYMALCALGLFCFQAVQGQTLRSAVPSLDEAPKPSVLHGGVSHRHSAPPKAKPVKKKPLQSSVKNENLSTQQGRLDRDASLKAGAARQDSQERLQYTIERSIGIIGVKFLKMPNRPPVINRVFPGTPAWNAGLSVNDAIVAVDGVPTAGLSKDQCYDLIVGTPATPVTISILKRGGFEAKNLTRMDFNDIPDASVRRDYLMSL